MADTNVVAQETGVEVLVNFVKYGGPNACIKVRPVALTPLIEKGLGSSRAGTKLKTLEALLLLIEMDTPTPVVEEIVPFLKHRMPKLVQGSSNALFEIVKNYGAKTVDPKLILPHLPKLFSHADKKVRAEATNITVELYKWIGSPLEEMLFGDLKPIQQKDLRAEFEKIKDQRPQQTRLLKTQQDQLAKMQAEAEANANTNHNNDNDDGNDVQMHDNNEGAGEIDAYDLVEATDILSQIPPSLPTKMKSAKWKERKEALEEIQPLFNAMKFKQDDYSELVGLLAKCMKDVNLQVVQFAAEIGINLNKGLRSDFNKYVSALFSPVLERTKEKKPSVLDPLLAFLDTMVRYAGLSAVVEDIISVALKSKVPKIKEEAYKFLSRCLAATPTVPSNQEVDLIMGAAMKGIGDMQAPVRNLAQEAIGVLMKVVGERPMLQYMEKIDDIKQKKIKDFFEKAEVKAVKAQPKPKLKPAPSATASTSRAGGSRRPVLSSSTRPQVTNNKPAPSSPGRSKTDTLLKKKLTSNASIPSKREASSPLKRDETQAGSLKASRGGLTSMPIGKSATGSSLTSKLESVASSSNFNNALTSQESRELEQLRLEKQAWLKQKSEFQNAQELHGQEKQVLLIEIESLKARMQDLMDEFTKTNLKLKSKDTQINRLKVDFEKSQETVHDLQEKLQGLENLSSSRATGTLTGSSLRAGNAASRLSMPISRVSMNFSAINGGSNGRVPNAGNGGNNGSSNIAGATSKNMGRTNGSGSGSGLGSKRFSVPASHKHYSDFQRGSNGGNDINTGVGNLTIEEKENTGYISNNGISGKNSFGYSHNGAGGSAGSASGGSSAGNGISSLRGISEQQQYDGGSDVFAVRHHDSNGAGLGAGNGNNSSNGNGEEWLKAHQVTTQLKQRIEKMKQRSRQV